MIELYSNGGKHEYEPSDPRATSQKDFVLSQKAGHMYFCFILFL